jgi:hypothetical protein
MEFFIPSLIIFLFAVLLSFLIIPKFSPLILAVLAIVLLVFGVYHHFKIFETEYRLSTWQSNLKIYAPAVMIIAIIVFIIYGIMSFFYRSSVPVPQMPNINIPKANTATNAITEALNTTAQAITNIASNVKENMGDAATRLNETVNALRKNNNSTKNNLGKNNKSRSFFETI